MEVGRVATIVGSTDSFVPGCGECGACCTGDGERYVRVTGNDHERLGSQAASWTRFIGNRCYMRMDEGRCAALAHKHGRWVCRIYESRPDVCRDLTRGSPECEAERCRKEEAARQMCERPSPRQ